MSLQRGIFIFLIISSLIGVSAIFVRRIAEATCPEGDTRICTFVNKNKTISNNTMKGMYTQVPEDKTAELSIAWEKGLDTTRVIIIKEKDELLDVIATDKYMYLKDYADNSWWRQEVDLVTGSLEDLPFYPDIYFSNLEKLISDKQTTYKFIQEAQCGNTTCYRYQLIHPDQDEQEQLFVFFGKDSFLLDSLLIARAETTSNLKIEYANISIVEPEQVKIAPNGQNLFLDYLDRKEKKEEKNYEYLKQFQQERIDAEQNGTNSGIIEQP